MVVFPLPDCPNCGSQNAIIEIRVTFAPALLSARRRGFLRSIAAAAALASHL
jgi:hypothetical protein